MSKLDASLLAHLPPFRGLEREALRDILDQASPRRHPEGTAIFREGEAAERFFLLLDGFVRVSRTTAAGEQVVLRHIPPGELIGIAPALGRSTYPATASAASEALTLAWPARLWSVFASAHAGFAPAAYATVGQRLEAAHEQMAELATQAVESRVAGAVLRMLSQSGRRVEGGIEIAFPVTRAQIAEMTGTTLHTVSRLLAAWEKDGLVESRRKHILVKDPHTLMLRSGAAG